MERFGYLIFKGVITIISGVNEYLFAEPKLRVHLAYVFPLHRILRDMLATIKLTYMTLVFKAYGT